MRASGAWVGLNWDREALNRRINARVKAMMAQGGWRRRAHCCDATAAFQTAAEATGYHELIEHIRGRLPLDDAIEQIKIATRQLARRQMKWFKRFRAVEWLQGERSQRDLAD